jgi:hypothetical protein
MSYFPKEKTIWLGPVELKYLREETIKKILDKMLAGSYFLGENLIANSGYWRGKVIGYSYYYIERDKKRNLTKVEAEVSTSESYDPIKELRYCEGDLAEIDNNLEWFYNYRKKEDLSSESREWADEMIEIWRKKKEKVMEWYWQLDNYISELNYLLNRTQRRLEKLKEIDDEVGRGSFKTLIEYVGEEYVRERLKEIFVKE